MSADHILAIDQGTTSSRAVVYDRGLRPVGQAQVEVPPTYPQPGWVEHDPAQLIGSVVQVAADAVRDAGIETGRLAGIGITNQRETALIWDRATGRALSPAIVWQDRRTARFCEAQAEHEPWLSRRTGLVLDAYFSATKFAWLLENVPGARSRAETGELAAGTVDSWLIWHLSGGRVHATDITNASRTLLMDLRTGQWGNDLCDFFAIPPSLLPEIRPSSGFFAETANLAGLPNGLPILGVAGDQQASLAGQGCVAAGQAKCTYGTGAFLLLHTGGEVVESRSGLVSTAAAELAQGQPQYALEGSVFIAGAAVQWFRDGLKAIGAAPEIDTLYAQGRESSGILFVPALTGLGAPHWAPEARGTIFGLTRDTSLADLARATIEGVAFQVADLVDAMTRDLGRAPDELRVDGGMARSDPFLQFQADLMGITLRRSPQVESTALGAALLAGLAANLWPDAATALKAQGPAGTVFRPQRDPQWRDRALAAWRHAVETVKRHYPAPGSSDTVA
ncbi:MAG: glycerol kinase [Isosphaeraceae bacterium]|jgi:glycerol kinase|nr:MAG: glycerol kinase [Isosphaeraceae bacterium]